MLAPSVFHALPAESQQFEQAYNLALGIIGLRRERLVHEGVLNAHIVRETMPLYDPVYRKWLISGKKGEENVVGQTKYITIEIPNFLYCPDGSHKTEAEALLEQEKHRVQQEKYKMDEEGKLLSKKSNDLDW